VRIRKANGAFIQLYPIWKNKIISKKTEIRIFNTDVKSVLLYACETWKVAQQISRRMQVFVNRCFCCILNLRWPDILSNEDLWGITKQEPITAPIRKRKWRWIGHTLRKPEGSGERAALDWNPQGA
jgi:hypothetical protein